MTRELDVDPEVIADLKLRAATERDRSRAPKTLLDTAVVGAWHCRNPQCRRLVDVTESVMEAFCVFNGELRSRGEEPLDPSKIVYCAPCLDAYKATAPARRRGQIERMAVAIRQLKESDDPTRDRDLIAQLEEWGHPDVTGLVQAIAERRSAESGRAGKRRSL